MSPDSSIRKFVEGLRVRAHDLGERADGSSPEARPLVREAISDLQVALEELQVTAEELRVQGEALAEMQGDAEADRARFADLFRFSPDATVATDPQGLIRAANVAAAQLLRLRDGELTGKPLAVYVADEERRAFRTRMAGLAQGDSARGWELRLQPRGALPVSVEVSAGPATVAGSPLLLWSLRDVTDRRVDERGRAETAETARMLIEAAPLPVAAMDVDGTVMVWNRAAERLLGWTEDEVVGRRNPALPADTQPGEEGTPAVLAGRRKAGGALPLRVLAAPMRSADGQPRGTVVVMVEATEEGDADYEASQTQGPAAGDPGERRPWTRAEALRTLLARPVERPHDIVDRLRGWIASGVSLGYLHPGDRLLSIREISQESGVDHRNVSAAYRTLGAEGVVEVRSRHGVYVGEGAGAGPAQRPLGETGEWVARLLGEAAELQVKVPLLPELLREWTGSTRVSCACVESTEDDLAALATELRQQWGLETFAVPVGASPEPARAGRSPETALLDELRAADLIVTTPFHAPLARAAARTLGKPLVVAHANPEMVAAVEDRLARGPLTAVVADAGFGERLRAIRGAADPSRLRIVLASDAEALAALDPAAPVLVTRAAHQKLRGVPLRLLVPLSPFLSPASLRDIGAVLIRRNMEASRGV
jgi:PAS domain S-box-containing protein